jgi:hypothetical protein
VPCSLCFVVLRLHGFAGFDILALDVLAFEGAIAGSGKNIKGKNIKSPSSYPAIL